MSVELPVLQTVESSNIAAVGHDGDDLFVEFHTGTIYQYEGVPHEVYEELLEASSVGRFFNSYIKNRYDYEQVA